MTDFNYRQYPVEVLESVIKRCEDDIKTIQNKIKRYNKRLTVNGGRGYSNVHKEWYRNYVNQYGPALIANQEEEIAECKADIASRA